MSVRVVARIRPPLEKELNKDIIVRSDRAEAGQGNTIVKIPNPRNEAEEFSFTFNSVYDQTTSQESFFNAEVHLHLKSLFQGYDVTIFAYGITGTGKTHTMRGGLRLTDRGVIPRLLSGIFRRGKKIMKDSQGSTCVRVALSYYEIYNDKVFDILESPEKRTPSGLPLRAEANGKTVVAGLSERACEDLKDFEKLYIEANNNRVTAATKLNAHSSRSHTILRVKLTQTTGDAVLESTASAIDLAGSEDNRRTDNSKERLVESAAINKSLFVLSQCIDAISRADKRIPYRESKMTRILSLGQNCGITVMILNLAPLRSYHLDTLSSLNVSSRAKCIEVREIENEVVFKQVPRANQTLQAATGVARQPLRPLANAHNLHSGNWAAKAVEGKQPVKAFSVYTDKARVAPAPHPAVRTSLVPRRSSLKRPSDHSDAARPSKVPRSSAGQSTVTVSAADIEAMVENKVAEILEARTVADKATSSNAAAHAQPQAAMNEAVQRRIKALKRRIESDEWRDHVKSVGLRYLLAARQHKERGDEAAALRAYELALPYFPGQAKLLGKIERLRARLGLDGTSAQHPKPVHAQKRRRRIPTTADGDDDYQEAADVADEEDMSFVEPSRSSKIRHITPAASKPSTTRHASIPDAVPASPRTQQLLDVVNSRDRARIRSLAGFGAKRARDLVDHLELAALDDDDDDDVIVDAAAAATTTASQRGRIETLAQLRAMPGVGGRTVERAYRGLVLSAS